MTITADGVLGHAEMDRLIALSEARRVLWVYPWTTDRPLNCAVGASLLVIMPGAVEAYNDHDPTAAAEQLYVIEKGGRAGDTMMLAGDHMRVLAMLAPGQFDLVVLDWCEPDRWDEGSIVMASLLAMRVAVVGAYSPERAAGVRSMIQGSSWHCSQGGNVWVLRSPALDWTDPKEAC